MKRKKSSFHPNNDLRNKHNFKPFNLIEKDGTIYERIFLDVPDPSLREQLICIHYLQHRVKIFESEPLGFNFVSRDEPWDFKIETSNNDEFNVEITSIANDSYSFEKMKREERLIIKSIENKLPLHEIIKLNYFFPTNKIEKLIEDYLENGCSKKDEVDNPFKDLNLNIFLSSTNQIEKNLENILRDLISKKIKKNHKQKKSTILIIDNRTLQYEMSEFCDVIDEISDLTENSEFPEIWLYTGYYSDNDGNNAEFSFIPIKITSKQMKKLGGFNSEKNKDGLNVIKV